MGDFRQVRLSERDEQVLGLGLVDRVPEPPATEGRLIRVEPSGLRVGEVMSSPAITVPMTASLADAARVMVDRRIHRLVALDDAGHPVGVLSSSDFVVLYADA